MRGVESALGDRRSQASSSSCATTTSPRWSCASRSSARCLLIAVGVSTAMARTLTRRSPSCAIGAARLAEAGPGAEEPVSFTGRNDEFAQVVRSVNALHGKRGALHEHGIATLERDRSDLVGRDSRWPTPASRTAASELADAGRPAGAAAEHASSDTFVNLSLRTLGLVERQLAVIEGLEEREQDPDRLATLFKLDHMATVMRRHSENMLVLAGAEHGHSTRARSRWSTWCAPRSARSSGTSGSRIQSLPPHAQIAGLRRRRPQPPGRRTPGERDLVLAARPAHVELSGWLLETGEVMLSVQDEGIGMAAERMGELNARLADSTPDAVRAGEGADGAGPRPVRASRGWPHRHGVRVQLREQKGRAASAAVVVLPQALLAEGAAGRRPAAGAACRGTRPRCTCRDRSPRPTPTPCPGVGRSRLPGDPLIAGAPSSRSASRTRSR